MGRLTDMVSIRYPSRSSIRFTNGMRPEANPCSSTTRDRPSIWTIRNRRCVGIGGPPRRRRRTKRSIARWRVRTRSSADIFIELHAPLQRTHLAGHPALARSLHAPHHIAGVIRYQKGAVLQHAEPDRATMSLSGLWICHETGQEVLRRAGGLAVAEWHEQDLVSCEARPVPGSPAGRRRHRRGSAQEKRDHYRRRDRARPYASPPRSPGRSRARRVQAACPSGAGLRSSRNSCMASHKIRPRARW